MGLFGKVKDAKQQAADAMQQATAMQQAAGIPTGGLPGAGTPGMGGQDMAVRRRHTRQKVNKIATAGVEAPGVIHSIRPAGTPDISGATMTDFEVTIRPVERPRGRTTDGRAIELRHRSPSSPTTTCSRSWCWNGCSLMSRPAGTRR